jgi:transcriptional regulator with XRE-family HTH domain
MIELTNKTIEDIQAIFKEIRNKKKIKNPQVAEKLNVSAPWASGMFKQFSGLSTERFIELAEAINANLYLDPQYENQTSIMHFYEFIIMVMQQLQDKQIDPAMACRKIQRKLKEFPND